MATVIDKTIDTSGTGDARYVYRFGGGVDDGGKGNKNLLGGKGANLDARVAVLARQHRDHQDGR